MENRHFLRASCSSSSHHTMNMQAMELTPLDDGLEKLGLSRRGYPGRRSEPWVPQSWRGPLRALRLIVLVALLPTLFIAVPLYLRFFVFSGQLYPVGMSDMRMIDKKVSTTWCQRQLLHSNATFNAFLMKSQPSLASTLVPVTMTRQLTLEDDMKEYWGFYLLQGSIVTVSTCVRWPGASLIMIRGHKHLQECAYIGDDSSEELEEILRANGGRLDNATFHRLTTPQHSNKPGNMTRHLKGVKFHAPRPPALKMNSPLYSATSRSDERDTLDTKDLKNILGQLRAKEEKSRNGKTHPKPSHMINVPELHRHRDTNINEEEGQFLSFKELEEHKGELLQKNGSYSRHSLNTAKIASRKETLRKNIERQMEMSQKNETSSIVLPLNNPKKIEENSTTEAPLQAKETKETMKSVMIELDESGDDVEGKISSSEVFQDVFKKLISLGKRGRDVLDRLNEKLASEEDDLNGQINKNQTEFPKGLSSYSSSSESDITDEDEKLANKKIDALRALLLEIKEDKQKVIKKRRKEKLSERRKREIHIKPAFQKELNEHDEKGNAAIEEGFDPDGLADHHRRINETTLNDMSRSEFWSSFSSSEEALLECDGLILNLPLTPHQLCSASEDAPLEEVAKANTVTYRVPSNGYYFFVFNSENEVQANYIRVQFDLQKTIYDLTNGTIMECMNSTDKCAMPLAFFSGEKVVFEVPVRDNDSLWNEDFVLISECEPRTSIYLICVIAVPFLIVVVAFQ